MRRALSPSSAKHAVDGRRDADRIGRVGALVVSDKRGCAVRGTGAVTKSEKL